MANIYLYRTPHTEPDLINRVGELPIILRQRILKKKNIQKKEVSLISYLLLQKALLENFDTELEHVKFLASGKPVLENNNLHFSISHSGNTIGVAISKKGAIGLDIQQFRKFKKIEPSFAFFSKVEQDAILAAKLPERKLIEFWSKKEALVKAVGGEMFEMSAHTDIRHSICTWAGCSYFLHPLNIKFDGYAWLASSYSNNKISITHIDTL